MSTPHRLSTWYTGTPDEDVLLVRNTGTNPIGSCIYKAPGIKPGQTGYQTRSTVERFPCLVPVTGEEPVPVAPVREEPTREPQAPQEAPPTPEPEPARTMSAREAVAFIATAGPGEYDHLRADPRRSVKDAIEERDHDHQLAGAR